MRYVVIVSLIVAMTPTLESAAQEGETSTVSLIVEDHRSMPSQLTRPGPGSGWKVIEVPSRGTAAETAALLADETGLAIHVNRSYPLLAAEDEPLFDEQWSLENAGQSGGTVDADVDAVEAWGVATGSGVVVAVVDSGVEPTHPELDDRLWVNPGETMNGIDDDGNGYTDDVVGWDFTIDFDNDPSPVGSSPEDAHGTYVAGVIAAEVNGTGVTGVAPDATIMNLRACDNGSCETLDAYLAILYAVDMGADIINLSFGGPVPVDEGDVFLESAISYAEENGVLVVSAAGNTPPDLLAPDEIMVPAELPHANNLAVAATDRNDEMASFSFYSENIDLAAPGVSILTTSLGSYSYVDGTSFSAPLTAGVAALLLSSQPSLGYAGVIDKLTALADQPSDVVGKVESGRLNAGRALTHKFIDTLGNQFEADIEWLADEGITTGCNPPVNTEFCPHDDVSRGVMAAFLVRALSLPAATTDYFTDDDGSTFEDDINKLAEAGVTKGCNPPANTLFCPDGIVNRGQMAAFLVRALGLSDDGGGDLFVDDDESIFEEDIDKLGTAGITKGCNPPANDEFCPDNDVSRGAMAAFLHRSLDP
ncbi:MAG: S8 family serine peptidase [Acidimicrobiia bacterium]|jgi:hypothetical protein